MIRRHSFRWLLALGGVGALALAAAPARGRTPRPPKSKDRSSESRRVAAVKSGELATRDGLRLRLVADLGNVSIRAGESGQVSYRVRIETDSRQPGAQELLQQYQLTARSAPNGVQLTSEVPWNKLRALSPDGSENQMPHVWINFEVTVPLRYNLEVNTQAGSIETQDLDGRVSLVTSGGNITAGRIGGTDTAVRNAGAGGSPVARLETAGGHISVRDVIGDLRAITAGGHISAGNIQGDAVLKTAGGHIRARAILGSAQLETGGGNISIERAGTSVSVSTGGGQIDFGEATGSIRARTGGGGIRIQRVAGPTQLETGGGSILLTRVQSAVHAQTGTGSITAWFTPETKLVGASQLESGQGDIVVYLPRELAITIDAVIETAADHHIEADPALPLKVEYFNSGAGGRSVRGACSLNGGGETLRLKTSAGNIRLKWSDTDPQVRLNHKEVMEQLSRRMASQHQRLLEQLRQQEEQGEAVLASAPDPAPQPAPTSPDHEAGAFQELQRKIKEIWWGALPVNPEAQQKKVVHSVKPEYPDIARHAGIEGTVALRVSIGKDGSVEGIKVLSGEQILANAAINAVRQWRYQPTLVDGKPINVVTTVTVAFKLR